MDYLCLKLFNNQNQLNKSIRYGFIALFKTLGDISVNQVNQFFLDTIKKIKYQRKHLRKLL